MKIRIICIGKTTSTYLQLGMDEYLKRLKHYAKVELIELADIKQGSKLPLPELQQREGDEFLRHIVPSDFVAVMDETGRTPTSRDFADFLGKRQQHGKNDLVILIGGAYGFAPSIYERVNDKISLSAMTFSHQMVRLFLLEQIYRGFTILRGEKYHH